MGHAIHWKLSLTSCKNMVSTISQASYIIQNQMDWPRNIFKLLRTCFTRQRRREKTCLNAKWSTTTLPCQATYNLLCKYYRVDLLDQTCKCLTQQGISLFWTQSSLEANTRMNICLHMTYTWVNMSCIRIQQTSRGSKLPLQASVLNQEVTGYQPKKVLHTEKLNFIWSHMTHRARKVKMNITNHNLAICRHLNLIASNLKQQTI